MSDVVEIVAKVLRDAECGEGSYEKESMGWAKDAWKSNAKIVLGTLESAGYVVVARGTLEVALGVLEECAKTEGQTGTNFYDDMELALSQLRLLTAPKDAL